MRSSETPQPDDGAADLTLDRLGGVRMGVDAQARGIAHDILARAVLDCEMHVARHRATIGGQRIGGDDCARIDDALGARLDCRRGVARDPTQDDASAALGDRKHEGPSRAAAGLHARRPASVLLPRWRAGIDLVHLNDARPRGGIAQGDAAACGQHRADAVPEVPRDLVG